MNTLLGLANFLGGYMAGKTLRRQEDAEERRRRLEEERLEEQRQRQERVDRETREYREKSLALNMLDKYRSDIERAVRAGNIEAAKKLAENANKLAETYGLLGIDVDAYEPSAPEKLKTISDLATMGVPENLAPVFIPPSWLDQLESRLGAQEQPQRADTVASPAPAPTPPALTDVPTPSAAGPLAAPASDTPPATPVEGNIAVPPELAPMTLMQTTQRPGVGNSLLGGLYRQIAKSQERSQVAKLIPNLLTASSFGAPSDVLRSAVSLATEDENLLNLAGSLANPTQIERWQSNTARNRAQARLMGVRADVIPQELALKAAELELQMQNARSEEEYKKAQLALKQTYLEIAQRMAELREKELSLRGQQLSHERAMDLVQAEIAALNAAASVAGWDDDTSKMVVSRAGNILNRLSTPSPAPARASSDPQREKLATQYLDAVSAKGFGKYKPDDVRDFVRKKRAEGWSDLDIKHMILRLRK